MTGRMLSAHYWTAFGIALVAFALVSPTLPAPVSAGPSPQAWGPASDHLQHIVTIVMENRDYDNYFATYCLTLGPFCSVVGNGIPSGTCVPDYPTVPTSPCTVPFNFTAANDTPVDLDHDWGSTHRSLNGGAMNGFYVAEAA